MEWPTLAELRARQSIKWRLHPEDVLPMWVAEMDCHLAPCVEDVLREAVARGDTGYAAPFELGTAFSAFAARQWGWEPKPHWCFPAADVMSGVIACLEVLTDPGDRVVICPPVYHPFFEVPPSVGRPVSLVPLLPDGSLDLPGIDVALADGAKVVLLSSPHNPTGRVWTSDELDQLDLVVQRHNGYVLADEVHAALTLPGAVFSPYLATPRRAVALVSGSKAFNLAGLKSALLVAGDRDVLEALRRLPTEVSYRSGHFGVLANLAAFREGDAWLAELVQDLAARRQQVGEGLPPGVTWTPPQAGYLAWLRFEGEDLPAERLQRENKVALVEGTDFGLEGHARLNFGTSPDVLAEGLRRLVSPAAGGAPPR